MGVDFVRKAAKSYKKSWDNGLVALGTADLFTRNPGLAACSAAFELAGDARLAQGEVVVVERKGGGLVARQGLKKSAHAKNPPAELLQAIDASCGIAKGTVEYVHGLAGVAEISLC